MRFCLKTHRPAKAVGKLFVGEFGLQSRHKTQFPFYSENDKWFRYLRDQYLINGLYDQVMINLMSEKEDTVSKQIGL